MQAPVCRDCFAGTLRGDVTPTGKENTIHGISTYVATPDPGVEPLGTVVIISDAFGWTLHNTRALADAYARRIPCTVYVPDFMNGHEMAPSIMTTAEAKPNPNTKGIARVLESLWLKLRLLTLVPLVLLFLFRTRASVCHPRITAFLRALRTSTSPPPRIAVAGFCWGGMHAVRLTHDVPGNTATVDGAECPLVDCAFTAHPSMLAFPEDVEKVVRPLSVANGDDDAFLPKEKMKRLVGILEGKNAGSGGEAVHETVVYPGAKHGFAVRGDLGDPLQKARGEGSEEQAVAWFRRHFGR
ncbi:alpha/beta-hydrolase [Trichocladium antarcticum]|uniref:Alpha/beta-hydrolase n=1 Tax=Trichocladium antarcticum TaxID=1450529 RepID=A0AAN6ZFE0_9PEZI|nr:alpha/beta-hydrolase [Trichocladium antarcticum]